MTLGDRVAVLLEGQLQQFAPPLETYHRPATVFVAGFIGSPTMNFLRCSVRSDSGQTHLESSGIRIAVATVPQLPHTSALLLGVRPHDIQLVGPSEADATARVVEVDPRGSEQLVYVTLNGDAVSSDLTIVANSDVRVSLGERICLRFRRDRLHLFDAAHGRRLN